MKFTAAIFALFAQASATTNFQVSVDEAEAMRTAQAIQDRVMGWSQNNQEDLTTAAMSVKTIVEQFLIQKTAYEGQKLAGMVKMADTMTKMFLADPEACDEATFAQCLVDSNAVDLMNFNEATLSKLFTTQCAVDNNCTTPCFGEEYDMSKRNSEYPGEDYWERYNASQAAYNASGCEALSDQVNDGNREASNATRSVDRAMEQVVMQEFQTNQETAMRLSQQFGELADGALEDFGCSEDCFEQCAIDRTTYNGVEYQSLRTDEEITQCAVYTCCTAVDIVSFDVTQTNTQCSFNAAKRVQCFTPDL